MISASNTLSAPEMLSASKKARITKKYNEMTEDERESEKGRELKRRWEEDEQARRQAGRQTYCTHMGAALRGLEDVGKDVKEIKAMMKGKCSRQATLSEQLREVQVVKQRHRAKLDLEERSLKEALREATKKERAEL